MALREHLRAEKLRDLGVLGISRAIRTLLPAPTGVAVPPQTAGFGRKWKTTRSRSKRALILISIYRSIGDGARRYCLEPQGRENLPLFLRSMIKLMPASPVSAGWKDHVYQGNDGIGQEAMPVRGLGERRGFLRSVSRRW
jgi:hypothetical protein